MKMKMKNEKDLKTKEKNFKRFCQRIKVLNITAKIVIREVFL